MDKIISQDLITELGLDKLPVERQQELFTKIGDLIFRSLMIRILDSMTEDNQAKLNNFLIEAGDNSDKVLNYLEKNVPFFNEALEQEIVKFKNESLGFMEALNK